MFNIFKYIRVKVAFFVLALLVVTMGIFYGITVHIMNRHILNEMIRRAEMLSKGIAATAAHNFLSRDLLGLDNIVMKVKGSNPDVEYIAILNDDRKAVVHCDLRKTGEILNPAKGQLFRKEKDGIIVKKISGNSSAFLEIVSPILFQDKQLGSVMMGINNSVLLDAQTASRKRILKVFGIASILGIIGSILLSSFLTRPIKALSSGVDNLKQGRRTVPLKVYSQDELGELTKNFNEMTAIISEQQYSLSRYAFDLETSYVSTVRVLAAAIDARDAYTHGHSARVSKLAVQLGRQIGLAREELEDLDIACLFHDVGKIKTPDIILHNEGRLNPQDYKEMMHHPKYGADILRNAPSLHRYIPAVRHHHEWFDGKGYPDGLRGDKIPLFAALIAIADAYDAMTSNRHYRNAYPKQKALDELLAYSAKQFNPELVNIFINIMTSSGNKLPGIDQ